LQKYSFSVKIGGLLIIEDVQSMEWIPTIKANAKSNFSFRVIDNREKIGRYDDIMVVLQRLS